MLQIISGKFFTQSDRFEHHGKGVIFGNYKWYGPIETCVATLDVTDTIGSVAPCVISYINQIEKGDKQGAGVLVRTGDWEIVEQFRLISIVGLRGFFHSRRDVVAKLCRKSLDSTSDTPPSSLIPRFFEPSIGGSTQEVEYFQRFVRQLIGLPRSKYLKVLAAIGGMASALEVVGDNIDLAYSLLVFSLESLCQEFDGFEPAWSDYPGEVVATLNPILAGLGTETAGEIRTSLLRDRQLRLRKRFVDFTLSCVRDSFYCAEAEGTKKANRKSELAEALSNAYQFRSAYAHTLNPIDKLLRMPRIAAGEILIWQRKPYLTLAGLSRLVQHVICSFVFQQRTLDSEDIDWRSELPGVVKLQMAPRYWIWQHEHFKPADATMKLEGFLQEYVASCSYGDPHTGLKDLMEKCEGVLAQANPADKLRMMALYCSYSGLAEEEWRSPNYETFVEANGHVLEDCSIESFITVIVLCKELPWASNELAAQWTKYEKQRCKPKGLRLPHAIELLARIRIGEAYLARESTQRHSMWLRKVLFDAAGMGSLQEVIRLALERRELVTTDCFWEAVRADLPKS